MFQGVIIIFFLVTVVFFLIIRFTLHSHFQRIKLPGNIFAFNNKIIKVYDYGGFFIFLLALLFLLLFLYA